MADAPALPSARGSGRSARRHGTGASNLASSGGRAVSAPLTSPVQQRAAARGRDARTSDLPVGADAGFGGVTARSAASYASTASLSTAASWGNDTPSSLRGANNSWAVPKKSDASPLRSCLLDPSLKCGAPQISFTDLHASRKHVNGCHESYDIDGDGFVGADDLALAKKYDVDGSGVLGPMEQRMARKQMAKDFFRTHGAKGRNDLWMYENDGGKKWSQMPETQAVQELSKSEHFTKNFQTLKLRERQLRMRGSNEMTSCLQPNFQRFARHPKATRSRLELLDGRKMNQRAECVARIARQKAPIFEFRNGRTANITNPAKFMEASCANDEPVARRPSTVSGTRSLADFTNSARRDE